MQRDEEKAWLLNKERHHLLVKSNETKKIRVSWEDFTSDLPISNSEYSVYVKNSHLKKNLLADR